MSTWRRTVLPMQISLVLILSWDELGFPILSGCASLLDSFSVLPSKRRGLRSFRKPSGSEYHDLRFVGDLSQIISDMCGFTSCCDQNDCNWITGGTLEKARPLTAARARCGFLFLL